LVVDGERITSKSTFYKKWDSDTVPVGKEIVRTLMNSKRTYRYAKDVLEREIEGRTAVVTIAKKMALRNENRTLVFKNDWTDLSRVNVQTASDLLSYILRQDPFQTDCHQAVTLALFWSQREWLGKARFDSLYEALASGPGKHRPQSLYVMVSQQLDPDAPSPKRADGNYAYRPELLPGDWVNFLNPGADSPWDGENAIYVGKDFKGQLLFFAHPIGIKTADYIKEKLAEVYREQRKPGEPRPELSQVRISILFEQVYRMATQEPPR
jgi:hypothetical protein